VGRANAPSLAIANGLSKTTEPKKSRTRDFGKQCKSCCTSFATSCLFQITASGAVRSSCVVSCAVSFGRRVSRGQRVIHPCRLRVLRNPQPAAGDIGGYEHERCCVGWPEDVEISSVDRDDLSGPSRPATAMIDTSMMSSRVHACSVTSVSSMIQPVSARSARRVALFGPRSDAGKHHDVPDHHLSSTNLGTFS
jgi:hypothetical protein